MVCLFVTMSSDRRSFTFRDSSRQFEAGNVAKIAVSRNWMWACARSVETHQPINIYAYAARSADGWLFDIHLGEKGANPCFGLQVPHVYVPILEIFISVYKIARRYWA